MIIRSARAAPGQGAWDAHGGGEEEERKTGASRGWGWGRANSGSETWLTSLSGKMHEDVSPEGSWPTAPVPPPTGMCPEHALYLCARWSPYVYSRRKTLLSAEYTHSALNNNSNGTKFRNPSRIRESQAGWKSGAGNHKDSRGLQEARETRSGSFPPAQE